MSVGRHKWIEKMCVCVRVCMVCTYSGVSFSAKKEGNSAIYDNIMNWEDILLNEKSQTHTHKILYDLTSM